MTDRYTKAIEQLDPGKSLDVRIGGIYALERIARDSDEDHPTIMEVLAAFIHAHSREQWPLAEPGAAPPERTTRPDVQAAATVIGRRIAPNDSQPVNLGSANLTRADLTGAELSEADLTGADLTGADLGEALLLVTNLTRADLTSAYLGSADLRSANLTGANLTAANLDSADLRSANLGRRTSPARTSGGRTSPARTSARRTSPARTSGSRAGH